MCRFVEVDSSRCVKASTCGRGLRSSRAVLFTSCSRHLKDFFFSVGPKLSFLACHLRKVGSVGRLAPELRTETACGVSGMRRLRFVFTLKGACPEVGAVGGMRRRVSPVVVLGNGPGVSGSVLLGPELDRALGLGGFTLRAKISCFCRGRSVVSSCCVQSKRLVDAFESSYICRHPDTSVSVACGPSNALGVGLSNR